MEEHIVRILNIKQVTHDVKRFQVAKPDGYSFEPGQATEVSVNSPEMRNRKQPFTFTCLTSAPYLEFTIKIYPERKGVTASLDRLNPGDELILRDVWGAIHYSGPGVFVAGGAGITPFLSILRDLDDKGKISGNRLIFANKTRADIIYEDYFRNLLGNDFITILSREKAEGYAYGHVNGEFLVENIPDFSKQFYVCGPDAMIKSVVGLLGELGIVQKSITIEL
jgi:ferredoxin-NADP reductase